MANSHLSAISTEKVHGQKFLKKIRNIWANDKFQNILAYQTSR